MPKWFEKGLVREFTLRRTWRWHYRALRSILLSMYDDFICLLYEDEYQRDVTIYLCESNISLCLFIRSSRLSASTSLANEILGIFIKYLLEYIAPDALQELHFKLSDLLKRVIKRLEHYF